MLLHNAYKLGEPHTPSPLFELFFQGIDGEPVEVEGEVGQQFLVGFADVLVGGAWRVQRDVFVGALHSEEVYSDAGVH